MTEEWERRVPAAIVGDTLWRVEAYRIALKAADDAWDDVTRLAQDRRTASLDSQLYRAIGSVGANIAEGYGRGSARDRAHFYEYSLSSAREARDWYFKARHILGDQVVGARLAQLASIIRLLLVMIPDQRGAVLREPDAAYDVEAPDNALPQAF